MVSTELESICFCQTVFFKKTDLRCTFKSGEAYRLIGSDADIADGIRRQRGIVLAYRRYLAVPIDCADSRPRKASFLSLMGSAHDDVMEHIVIGFCCMKDRELDAKFILTEGLELVIDEVPMLRNFTACLLIEHHLTEHRLIQRLIVVSRQKKGCYAVLTAAA